MPSSGGGWGRGGTGQQGATRKKRNRHFSTSTMSSALETLLEAARFLELQEQQGLQIPSSPPTSSSPSSLSNSSGGSSSGGGSGRYHHNHHQKLFSNTNNSNNNSTNNINSKSNNNIVPIGGKMTTTANIRNNDRHHHHQQQQQLASPPISPVFPVSNMMTASTTGGGSDGDGGGAVSNHSINGNHFSEYGSAGAYLTLPSSSSTALVVGGSSTTINKNRPNNGRNSNATNGGGQQLQQQQQQQRHYLGNIGGGITTVIHNSNNILAGTVEDSSQSSLNLSSSGYLSCSSSANSSGNNIGVGSSISTSPGTSSLLLNGAGGGGGELGDLHHHYQQQSLHHHIQIPIQQTTGRRRTTSTNSNGSTQRSPCILRAGTREVHNKLEKHRRAHLKECFEQLKVQLQLRDEEKKKTSNLAILGAAYKHVVSLKRKERELEQQVEQLAKEKINAQKKIVSLRRELSAKYDHIDFTNIANDSDITNIPGERDSLSDSVSLSSGRGSTRYSSSSSLSSGATVSSPIGSSMQTAMATTMSPVLSSVQAPSSPHLKISSPIAGSCGGVPLSLTTKTISGNGSTGLLTRYSPVPSLPSPSSNSGRGGGVSSSSPIVSQSSCSSSTLSSSSSSSSSPIGGIPMSTSITQISSSIIGNKVSNIIPNGMKITTPNAVSSTNIQLISSTTLTSSPSVINFTTSENAKLSSTFLTTTTSSGMPLNFNTTQHQQQNVQILNTTNLLSKDLSGGIGVSGKNGISRKIPSDRRESSSSTVGGMILTTNFGTTKEIKVEKIFDESEQPTKVIKLFNGIALAPVIDKDNKLLSSSSLSLSQMVGGGGGLVVSPFPMLTSSSQGLRVIGTNGLATIELSSPNLQTRHQQQSNPSSVSSITTSTSSGAQFHKLLVSGCTTTVTAGNSVSGVVSSPITHSTSVTSELARLPGGAELNILPTGANGTTTLYRGNGKLAIVNNGIALKDAGCDVVDSSGRAVHVVTPLQSSGAASISGLTPIVVSSQGQAGNNLAHLIASSPQLAGKVNLSVGGQALPLISTQYLSSMKPMVVAVASNTTTSTLSSVPPTTSTTGAAATAVTASGGVS